MNLAIRIFISFRYYSPIICFLLKSHHMFCTIRNIVYLIWTVRNFFKKSNYRCKVSVQSELIPTFQQWDNLHNVKLDTGAKIQAFRITWLKILKIQIRNGVWHIMHTKICEKHKVILYSFNLNWILLNLSKKNFVFGEKVRNDEE